jgi:hypothetical protein
VKVGQIVGKMPVRRLAKTTTSLVDCDTLLGVEVEAESVKGWNADLDARAGYWLSKEDGSLRNGGMEFVFAEPLFGADAVAAVEYLCKTAQLNKWSISERTGLHVHVDVRSMELEQFRLMLTTYALMEPLVYNWVGDRRQENMFCLPWYHADTDIDLIAYVLSRGEKEPLKAKQVLKDLKKYTGLNLTATYNFGTVEYRQLKTTFDFNRIIMWLNIVLSIKKFACTFNGTPDDVMHLGRTLGAQGLAIKVFGAPMVNAMWYNGFNMDYVGKALPTIEHFLETPLDKFFKNNPDATIFDYFLNKQLESKDPGVNEADHPGVIKFKQRKGRTIKVNVKKGKLDDQFLADKAIKPGAMFAGVVPPGWAEAPVNLPNIGWLDEIEDNNQG